MTAGGSVVTANATFGRGIVRLRGEEQRCGRAPESVSAVVLQELGRAESLAETPFGADPHAWLAAQRAAGADEAIVTVRSAEDVATVSAMMRR